LIVLSLNNTDNILKFPVHKVLAVYAEYYSKLSFNGEININVKKSRNKPDVAQRVPGVLGYQISMIFDT